LETKHILRERPMNFSLLIGFLDIVVVPFNCPVKAKLTSKRRDSACDRPERPDFFGATGGWCL